MPIVDLPALTAVSETYNAERLALGEVLPQSGTQTAGALRRG